MLSRAENERYERQIILSNFGPEGQARVKAAKILIIGVGGLGAIASLYLVCAGVGTIGLVEHDIVDASNLHRQILYTEADATRSKLALAKSQLLSHNSSLVCIQHDAYLDSKNAADIISRYDLVLDATDNIKSRYLISDVCAVLKVYGSA